MAEYIFQEETMASLADAFRYKTKDTTALSVEDMRKLVYLLHYDLDGGVTFYNSDNKPIYSYSINEANNLTEMPAGNDIPWRSFIGWSHSLDDINSTTSPQVVTGVYEKFETTLGFTTKSNQREMWFYVDNDNPFEVNLEVDWGDGTANEKIVIDPSITNKTITHKYPEVRSYEAKIYSESSNIQIYCKWYINKVILGRNVTIVKDYAFQECEMQSIIIPNTVLNIGVRGFYSCKILKNIIIPDSVESIGNSAFSNCTSLESITIGSKVTSIGSYIFTNCSALTTINYRGTEEQWKAIKKGTGNDFSNFTINYNYDA